MKIDLFWIKLAEWKRKIRLNKKYICSINLAWIECNDVMKRVQPSKKDKWSWFSKDTLHIHGELSKESLSKNGMWPQLWNYIQQKKWGGKLIIHLWQRERRWKFQKEIECLEIKEIVFGRKRQAASFHFKCYKIRKRKKEKKKDK